ncbi:hypothetical protein BS78_02G324600 [Paspalum vaginatum]|nr:hypothetical protein BS78_02G324600 [Paspalum vaginatum]
MDAVPRGQAWLRGLGGSRARSRSPCRREKGCSSRDGYRHRQLHVPAGYEFKLPSLQELKALETEGLQKLFATEATALRADLSYLLADQVQHAVADFLAPARAWLEDAATNQKEWLQQAENYIGKACLLADKLNIAAAPLLPGNQAWSGVATVPVSAALGRILHDLRVRNAAGSCGLDREEVEEVEAALCEMEIAAAEVETARPDSSPALQLLESAPGGSQEAELGSSPLPTSPTPGNSPTFPAPPTQEIDRFFSTPCLPLLQQAPPPRQQRRRKAYDMANIRHSARLASRPAMPAMRRAQINLCRLLGLPADEEDQNSMEQVLKEYVAMYDTSLPDFAIAALTNLLCVGDEYMEQLDDALIGLAGQGIEGLLDAEGAPAVGVAAEE